MAKYHTATLKRSVDDAFLHSPCANVLNTYPRTLKPSVSRNVRQKHLCWGTNLQRWKAPVNVSIVRRERAQAQVLSPSKAAMKRVQMRNLKAKKKRSNEAERVHKNRNRQVHRIKNASASAGSAPRPHPSRTLQEQRTSARCRRASPGPGSRPFLLVVLCRACHDLRHVVARESTCLKAVLLGQCPAQ